MLHDLTTQLENRQDPELAAAGAQHSVTDAAQLTETRLELQAKEASSTIAALSAELESERKDFSEVHEGSVIMYRQAQADAEAGLAEARDAFEREKGELLETVADLRSEGVQMRVAHEESRLELENMSKAVARAEQSASEAQGSAVVERLEQELADAREDSARLLAALDALEAAATPPAVRIHNNSPALDWILSDRLWGDYRRAVRSRVCRRRT